jgi:hypothetical protein
MTRTYFGVNFVFNKYTRKKMNSLLFNENEKNAASSIGLKAETLKRWRLSGKMPEPNTSMGLEPKEYLLDPENPEELEIELALRAGLVENDDDDFDSE